MAQTTVAGTTPGQFSVNESGAATYSIPIQVPPGVAGMQPQLSLEYNSQSGNGLLGMGWSLSGLSAITRCPRTMAQDGARGGVNYDMNDRFCLDGQRLVLVSGTYGAANSEYRTERESFSKIIAYGTAGNGPAYFTMQTKAGLTMELGNTADSQIEAQGKPTVRVWALNRVQDVKTNFMTFGYYESADSSVYAPLTISYGGNTVSFEYDTARFDKSPGYVSGSLVQTDRRVTSIKTNAGGVEGKVYRAVYESSLATQRSRLLSVAECYGSTESICFPATNISYGSTPSLRLSAPQYTPPVVLESHHNNSNLNHKNGVQFIDLNGDGLLDIVQNIWAVGSSYTGAWFNTGSGWTGAPQYALPVALAVQQNDSNLNHSNGVRFIDLNGDGLLDIVQNIWAVGSNYTGAWLNTGSGWVSAPQYIPPVVLEAHHNNGNLNHKNGVQFIDLNGDGLLDIVQNIWAVGSNYTGAWLNTGAGWVSAPQYIPPVVLEAHHNNGNLNHKNGVQFIDLNGDGLLDIVQNIWAVGSNYTGAWLNTGAGWVSAPQYIPPVVLETHHNDSNLNHRNGVQLIDLNGDGLLDIVQNIWAVGSNYTGAWLNTGAGWVSAPQYIPPVVLETHHNNGNLNHKNGVQFIDLNGDGLLDIVQNIWAVGSNYTGAWLNTGAGWVSAPQYIPPVVLEAHHNDSNLNHRNGVQLIDLNGDGLLDIVQNIWAVGSSYFGAWVTPKTSVDVVLSIANGLSPVVSISHNPITDASIYTKDSGTDKAAYPKMDLQFPRLVVSSVASSNGVGGVNTVQYSYGGLKAEQGTGRGSLGFRWMKSKSVANNIESYTEFNQNHPFTGTVTKNETRLAGSGNAGLLKRTTNTYAQSPGSAGASVFVYPSQSVEESWDLSGSPYPGSSTSYVYGQNPQYGDPTQITVSNSEGSSKTTVNEYWPVDSNNWILGRLKKATVTSVKPN
ncbi:hypothetical protein B0B52_13570 [Polaromonas sp. A23]|nr:hypothetical protein B0B52_13570 [Polaromonas sp. A23]